MSPVPTRTAVVALGVGALAPSAAGPNTAARRPRTRENLSPAAEPRGRGRRRSDLAVRPAAAGTFREGSMAPKVRAAIDVVRRTGGRAMITEVRCGREAVLGLAGTTITPEST